MNYHHKYSKYKYKYIKLKNKIQLAGADDETEVVVNTNKSLSDGNNEFTIDLFDNLESASNIFSPLGIIFALSLIHQGTLGVSSSQITKVLGYKYSTDDLKQNHELFNNSVIKMINVFIINKNLGLKKDYTNTIDGLVKIIKYEKDNAALSVYKANRYITNRTDGMMMNVVPPINISIDQSLIIINTVYFKASWQHKFDIRNTIKMPFHQTQNNLVEIMHQTNDFKYYENKSVQLIELPYDEKDYVMGIILPLMYLEGNNLEYSINNVPQFSMQEINELINNTEYTLVDLFIPKFVQRKKFHMIPTLKKMGITEIFDTTASEFDVAIKKVCVSDFIHEAVIIIDEIGTEALDASIKKYPAKQDTSVKTFKADHAFIYYIRHIPSGIFLLFGDYQGNPS